ncbi:MAG: cytochrome c [Candidatus Latescibacteria bacterium]|jgi:mono/diheme cytochrome c family protein|nr:cytochrome c [Candidatus Latescibacterota bacterium]MDP7449386.1 cytochrome c [Candidatus Latescibacterota bacterium]HJP30571.1 cytochrome c [Candidatus Latescibacterota bacterium]
MNLWVVLPIAAAMLGLKLVRPHVVGWLVAWWVALFLVLHYGIEPPLPVSIINMFMGIITLSLLAYLSSNSEYLESVRKPVVTFLVEERYSRRLMILMVGMALLVAVKVNVNLSGTVEPPIASRTIHPPPPGAVTFQGKRIDLVTGTNPFRELEESDPDRFGEHVRNGSRIYYQNCVFCHGDNLQGKGIYAYAFDPIPANFSDPTTIAMLQESYLFWRIAKGAPGLPPESAPWSSAMPAWEKFLTEEEIWEVTLFLYDFTGQKPRAQEHVE